MDIRIWADLLDEFGRCRDESVAKTGLKNLYDEFNIPEGVFASKLEESCFKSFRHWLACEGQTEIQKALETNDGSADVWLRLAEWRVLNIFKAFVLW